MKWFCGIFLGALTSLGTFLLAPTVAADAQPALGGRARVRIIEQSARSVRVELRAARAQGDAARARCVSSKLTQVHAQLRLAEEHAPWLDRPNATLNREELRRHEYALKKARARARELAEEARYCSAASLRAFELTVTDGTKRTQVARARR